LGLRVEALEPAHRVSALDRLPGEGACAGAVRHGEGSLPYRPVLWIPITLAAAALQTARNAFQRSLTGALSPLGATTTRFLFGFPFAAFYAGVVFVASDTPAPAPRLAFLGLAALGGVAQILGTAFLLQLFQLRNFSTGIAFSKSEILQVALVGMLVLGDRVTPLAGLAIEPLSCSTASRMWVMPMM
jgi:drug/metabolite transporter (DMT)-like permease